VVSKDTARRTINFSRPQKEEIARRLQANDYGMPMCELGFYLIKPLNVDNVPVCDPKIGCV
jgi:hypothetical protein